MLVQQAVNARASQTSPEDDWVICKVDVINAFNCLSRGQMLQEVARAAPHLLPWLKVLYGSKLPLFPKGGK